MLRLIVISASLLAVAGCESKPATPAGARAGSASGSGSGSGSGQAAGAAAPSPSEPPSSLARVQAAMPKGSTVAPVDLKVPDHELFAITPAKQSDEEFPAGELVALAKGGRLVRARDVLRGAAVAKADAATLARIAMWIVMNDGELLDKASTPEQRKAGVRAPAIKGETLTFWVLPADEPRILERGIVGLTTAAIELGPLPAKPEVMVSNAIKTLLGTNVRRHGAAIQRLAGMCTNPRAKQSLLAALSSHPRDRTRASVADEIHRCGAAVVDPLIYSMENDSSAMVRPRAASALGRVGEPRARPALAKAARSEDANLVWAAKNALGKLK